MHSADLLAIDKSLANKLQAFTALNHLDNEILLKFFMILLDILIKFLVSTTNLSGNIFSFLLEINGFVSNQEKVHLDPDNWNSDIHLFDHSLDLLINFLSFPRNKFDWCLREQNLALLFNFLISYPSVVNITLNVVLIGLRLLLSQLEES